VSLSLDCSFAKLTHSTTDHAPFLDYQFNYSSPTGAKFFQLLSSFQVFQLEFVLNVTGLMRAVSIAVLNSITVIIFIIIEIIFVMGEE
jgi:hypothetical protein